MAKNKRAVYDVSPEQFVLAWQASENADEVARKLNMPKNIVLARASNYRDMGVKLKKMKRARKRLDVNYLNELILGKSAAAEQAAPAPQEATRNRTKKTPAGDVDSQIRDTLRARLRNKVS